MSDDAGTVLAEESAAATEAAAQEPADVEDVRQPAAKVDAAPAVEDGSTAITPEIYGNFGLEEGSFDPQALDAFKGILADAKLPKDVGIKLASEIFALEQNHREKNLAAQNEAWLAQTKADAEFGGAKVEQTQSYVAAALNSFGGADATELRSLFNETGLGNHPAFVRFFARAGKAVSEDGMINSGAAASREESAANLLFPSMKGK